MSREELRRLNEQATPGPWKVSRGSTFNEAELRAPDPWNGLMLIRRAAKPSDIEFIAAVRNALPALLEIAEAARAVGVFDIRATPFAGADYHGYRLIPISVADDLTTAIDAVREAVAALEQA